MTFNELAIGSDFVYAVKSGNHFKATKLGPDRWRRYDAKADQTDWNAQLRQITSYPCTNSYTGAKNMLTEITTDLKGYVRKHKDHIYTIILIALIDQYVFEGQFRERLRTLVGKVLGKAEEKVNSIVDGTTV